MNFVYLERMFRPRSVAVVGANNRPQRVGNVIMRNLLASGFDGPIMPVNPRYDAVAGVLTYPDIASLPRTPDLAILCTPAETIPDLVDELGARGTRAAVVVARGLAATPARGPTLLERTLAAAKAHRLRLLGGGTLGLQVPSIGLNASFSRVKAMPGNIGFVSQSDAVGTLVLDWAHPRRVGFSHFVSLGDAADIGFGEMLDYLGSDPDTRAILLYIESLRERRTFMAAARGAARNKPVLAIKAGRPAPGSRRVPISSDTLSLVDPDDVFDAALRRAGIVRVRDLSELFDAVETLARSRPMLGDRLAIVSNGGGAGLMAADELHAGGLGLPELSEPTVTRLRTVLPPTWDGRHPIDILVDAPAQRYADVLRILSESKEFDAILLIHTPSTLASSTEAARAVIQTVETNGTRNVLASWVGGETVPTARKMLVDAGIPHFDTPADAARAFRFMVGYRRSHEALIQTPPSAPIEFEPDPEKVRGIVKAALAEGRDYLVAPERMAVLAAYGIPTVDVRIARTPEEAAAIAAEIGFPVEVAIRSPDVRRKPEVGAVASTLETGEAVAAAARGLVTRLAEWRPDARITGFTVQRVVNRPHARPLFVGTAADPIFGPVILFGEGRATELFRDFAVGLPPVNLLLARGLIARTRVATLLEASPARPAADLHAISLTLVKFSQLLVDVPELVEMDVNPLLADEHGVLAAGAYMRIARADPRTEADRLAVRPYPKWLEETITLRDGRTVLLRPIRPEDEPSHHEFLSRLSPEDSRFRFFHYVRSMPHSELARLTQIDYDREMAFIATTLGPQGEPGETLGVIRAVADPDNEAAEFSVVVRSDTKRQGLASRMLRKLVDYCRNRGTKRLEGEVLAENSGMLEMVKRFGGFTLSDTVEEGTVRVVTPCSEPPPSGH